MVVARPVRAVAADPAGMPVAAVSRGRRGAWAQAEQVPVEAAAHQRRLLRAAQVQDAAAAKSSVPYARSASWNWPRNGTCFSLALVGCTRFVSSTA